MHAFFVNQHRSPAPNKVLAVWPQVSKNIWKIFHSYSHDLLNFSWLLPTFFFLLHLPLPCMDIFLDIYMSEQMFLLSTVLWTWLKCTEQSHWVLQVCGTASWNSCASNHYMQSYYTQPQDFEIAVFLKFPGSPLTTSVCSSMYFSPYLYNLSVSLQTVIITKLMV